MAFAKMKNACLFLLVNGPFAVSTWAYLRRFLIAAARWLHLLAGMDVGRLAL
jgi:hypothetical protein